MRLFIRMLSASPAPPGANPAADTIPCQWLLRDDRGQTLAQGDSLAEGLAGAIGADGVTDVSNTLADPDNIVVLAPSAAVAWLSCAVPGRRAAQIRRALPFAVEESLTQDVETMHLAHGPIVRGQPIRCALIDRQLIADWIADLNDRGLRPGHMVPDACLLPCDESGASVLFDGAETLVRTPEDIANVGASTLPDVLDSIRASFDATKDSLDLNLVGGDLADARAEASGFSVCRTPLHGTVLEYLAARWETGRPEINLLQGPFAPSTRPRVSRAGWRGVAGLAAIWLFIVFAWLIAEGYVANHRAEALETESTDLYRSIYPNERRVPNAYAQMRAKLRQADTGQAGFHTLLGQLAAGTAQDHAKINVRSITFNESRGELTSELWLPDYAELDRLKLDLEGRGGLAVDISSAEERDDIVRARLRIRLAGELPG